VDHHVVMSAQEDAVGNIGSAALRPFVDVVGLGPGDGPVAAGEPASSIPGRERDALPCGEGSLGSSDVENLTALVELDGNATTLAEVALDGGDADRVELPVDPAKATALAQVAIGNVDLHHRVTRTEHGAIVHIGGDANQLDEGIDRDLVVAALVTNEFLRGRAGIGVDESGAAPRRERGIDGVDDMRRRLGIQQT
jgi:hypothetical protein